jgi:hypothetical protein
LDKHKIEHGKREHDFWLEIGESDYSSFKFFIKKQTLVWFRCDNHLCNSFSILCTKIYPDYQQGDLTQFHRLFTQIYNEIMEYEIVAYTINDFREYMEYPKNDIW